MAWIGSSVTLLSSLTVVLSVLYDWTYFQYIGFDYFGVLSLSDHLSGALKHLPITLLSLFMGAMIITVQVAEDRTLLQIIRGTEAETTCEPTNTNGKTQKHYPLLSSLPLFVVLEILAQLLGSLQFLAMGCAVVVIVIDRTEEPFARIFGITGRFVHICIFAITIVLMLITFLGATFAAFDIRMTSHTYLIKREGIAAEEVDVYRLTRAGVIGKSVQTDQTFFMPWESVELLEYKEPIPAVNMCRWWGIGCPDKMTHSEERVE